MTANIEYEVPTWSQIYDMLLSQAQKIHISRYKPDIVVGVARGGIIPARILTDLLRSARACHDSSRILRWHSAANVEPILKQALTTNIAGKKALIVDDIADTGKSLKLAKNYLQQQGASQIMTATLYTKPQSITTPDFYEKQTSSWVVFPWDTKETLRRIVQKEQGKRTLNQEIAKLVKAGLPKQLAEKLLEDMQ